MRRALALALWVSGCSAGSSALPLGSGAADCASCHPTQADAFSRSAHARSEASPVLRAMLPEVEASWGAGARARCESCHAPQHGSDMAVTCVSCHAAVGNHGARDGALVVDLDVPLAGPFADADAEGAHGTRVGELLASSELCATCHELTGPALFVETTATEHARAVRELAVPRCQECHLPLVDDGPIAAASARARPRRDHRFVGLTPPLDPAGLDAYRAEAVALLDDALELEASLEGRALRVSLTNVGAGHAVPTGVAALRDIWVEVALLDDSGSGDAPRRIIELGDRPLADDRAVALPTEADRIEHRALGAGETRSIELELPSDARAAVITLRARPYRADLLARLGVPDTVGTLEVVARTIALR